jgi:hypothetical protein
MKKIIIIIICCILHYNVIAQTNTFPSTGSVGVGTVSPTQKFHVAEAGGVIGLFENTSGTADARVIAKNTLGQHQLGIDHVGSYIQATGGTSFRLITGSTDNRFFVRATGDVGIGTDNPFTRFSVGDNVGIGLTDDALGDMVNKEGLLFQTTQQSYKGAAIVGKKVGNYGVDLLLGTREAGGNELKERMRIMNTGYVGIGTTNPSQKLHVAESGAVIGLFENITGTADVRLIVKNTLDQFQTGIDNIGGYFQLAGGTPLRTYINGLERMRITAGGNMGIGTEDPGEYKLAVNGKIRAKKLIVETGWSDYVFADDYKLRSLSSVESFIKQNKRLPDIPSAKEVEKNGISVGENQALLLKKIEEMTLYMIAQQKEITQLRKDIQLLQKKKS